MARRSGTRYVTSGPPRLKKRVCCVLSSISPPNHPESWGCEHIAGNSTVSPWTAANDEGRRTTTDVWPDRRLVSQAEPKIERIMTKSRPNPAQICSKETQGWSNPSRCRKSSLNLVEQRPKPPQINPESGSTEPDAGGAEHTVAQPWHNGTQLLSSRTHCQSSHPTSGMLEENVNFAESNPHLVEPDPF